MATYQQQAESEGFIVTGYGRREGGRGWETYGVCLVTNKSFDFVWFGEVLIIG